MPDPGKLLIVDDEAVALRNLERVMSKAGYDVTAVQSGEEALALIETQKFDLLLTDLRMEKVDGMRLLKTCRTLHPDSEVIMITGYASAQSAVEAMKQGGADYLHVDIMAGHYVPNFTNQFGSTMAPAAMVWVGYSMGDR